MTLTIGIDYDSYALHVCGLPTDGGPPTVVSSPLRKKGDDEHRALQTCHHSFAYALRWIHEVRADDPLADLGEPEAIGSAWIERGYGASRRADFVLGAIYGACFAASSSVLPGVSMRPLLAGDWKRDVTGEMGITTKTGGRGNGNVKKEIANDCARQLWAREWPLAIIPVDANQLDAFSIAWAGSRL